MTTQAANPLEAFQWAPQPQAEAWVTTIVEAFLSRLPEAAAFSRRLYDESGNRFADLIDTVLLSADSPSVVRAEQAGWTDQSEHGGWRILRNTKGIFPPLAIVPDLPADQVRVDLKLDSVADFLAANGLTRPILGEPGAPWRWAKIWEAPKRAVLGVTERHGWRGYQTDRQPGLRQIMKVLESFRTRRRDFDSDEEGFAEAERLIDAAIAAVGRDYACDLFFAAEREYWQRRNRAGQVQKARQDRLGIGWANHDHHTYRCSRQNFTRLAAMWETLGFHCRERFYAGRQAGWGAQVMEQPIAGIVTFNDVDLTPDELFNDFAHEPLAPQPRLGTVGLWCGLHGDSFLQAGMHHLECQFDFEALREQLEREADVKTMKPFTDFAYLRQAFTEGQRWPVRPQRIERLLEAGLITAEQAEQFRTQGAIGSHLENLERHGGFKGFNQDGVSEIISDTDPRRNLQ